MSVDNRPAREIWASSNDKLSKLENHELEHYRLLKQYEDQIRFICDRLRETREERRKFFDEQLPEILRRLRDEAYVDEAALPEWRDMLTTQMGRSFEMSESLLSRYVMITPVEKLEKEILGLCQDNAQSQK